ncbi:enoyl-CoA hydratase-related protein [Corynebacterium sanguinis]|uniref:enoyl-CoA hydratase-related protein n=1 Tax=Corynebacterium sanguinis TaxID=2594913 RepID=UPI0021A370B7|nr:enoyl-CoA hydratase-related protein [Corynebacterium sanguinis]MCT1882471.1 enoyl-CoA hydratase-related protein [Corynebacterium sanguinis]
MDTTTVRLERNEAVATLTITSKMGAMGRAFWEEVPHVLATLGDARVLVLRGVEVFSAGLDVKDSAEQIVPALGNPEKFTAVVDRMHAVTEGVAGLPIPVVAAVNGWCVGAGLELIAAEDIRLCSSDARFSLPEVKLGITADLGGLQRLPHIVGRGRAAHLALTGEPIDARTAESWGLVTEVLGSPEALFARAEELGQSLAGLPPKALEGTKRTLVDGLDHNKSMKNAVLWNAQHVSVDNLQEALFKNSTDR